MALGIINFLIATTIFFDDFQYPDGTKLQDITFLMSGKIKHIKQPNILKQPLQLKTPILKQVEQLKTPKSFNVYIATALAHWAPFQLNGTVEGKIVYSTHPFPIFYEINLLDKKIYNSTFTMLVIATGSIRHFFTHLFSRLNENVNTYEFIYENFDGNKMILGKRINGFFYDLGFFDFFSTFFYDLLEVKLITKNNILECYENNNLRINAFDIQPLETGKLAFRFLGSMADDRKVGIKQINIFTDE